MTRIQRRKLMTTWPELLMLEVLTDSDRNIAKSSFCPFETKKLR